MTESELIKQLKDLGSIELDREWVVLTRASFIPQKNRNIFDVFSLVIPKPFAISAMAAIVALLGGVHIYNTGLIDVEVGKSVALTASLEHVSDETAGEVAEIQEVAVKKVTEKNSHKTAEDNKHAVVFNKDAEERENFQTLLRERIETKIAYVKDLFAQVEDGESIREILQNPRRYEENFKIFGEGLDEQVKQLVMDAEEALADGDLITALDLVNAIEKLIKE